MKLDAILKSSALSAALLALIACSESSSLVEQVEPTGVPVRAAEVVVSDDGALLYFAGVARSRQRASLSFQVGGVMSSRPVEIGQRIEAQELIATLYNPQLAPAAQAAQARLAQLQADLQQAERELLRLEQLHKRGLLANQNLEQQQTLIEGQNAAIDNAMATLQQSEDLNSESILRAPFSGTIDSVLLEPGEFVQPGQAVVRLAGLGVSEVEIRVPPHLLEGLEIGAQVPVKSSLSGRELTGSISEIARASTGDAPLLAVIVALPESEVLNAEALEVALMRKGQSQPSIPLSSVMRSAAGLSVFKVQDGRAQRVVVEVEKISGERAFIRAGSLRAGERVVYAGISRLADGDALEILQ